MSLIRKVDTSTTLSSGRSEDEEEMYSVEMGSPVGDSDSSFSDPRQSDSDKDPEKFAKESEKPLLEIIENVNLPSLQLDIFVEQKEFLLEKAKRIREDRVIKDDQKMLSERSNKILKFSPRLPDNSENTANKNLPDIERLKPNDGVENEEKNSSGSERLETSRTSEDASIIDSPAGRLRENVEADCSFSSSDEKESLLPSPSSPTTKSVSPRLINKIESQPWNKRLRGRRIYCADDILKKVNEKLGGLAIE